MSAENRKTYDRRRKPTSPFDRFFSPGRRGRARRLSEGQNYYVDRYGFDYLLLIVIILVFCLLDAYLTLQLMRHGGIELNPLMSFLIRKNAIIFLMVKLTITAISTIFLLVHKNFVLFRSIKVRNLIYFVFTVYLLLICYEAYLFFANLI